MEKKQLRLVGSKDVGTTLELYAGDVIDAMEEMEDKCIDLMVADYPFNIQDGRDDYIKFLSDTVKQFSRIAKDVCNLVVIQNPSNIFKMGGMFDGWTLVNELALIRKGALRPAWHFGFQHNTALILNRGGIKNKWNGAKKNHDKTFLTDVIEYQNGYRGKGKNNFHPQAIGRDLSDMLVKVLSDEGDNVFDAFAGSGTVALSCVENERNYFGVEIEAKYIEMIEKRLWESGYRIEII